MSDETRQFVHDEAGERARSVPVLIRVLLPIFAIALGGLGYWMLSIELEKPKQPEGKPRVLKTRVRELHAQDFVTSVKTRGTVRPHNEVTLTPQVSGKIVRVLPAFEDGAFFSENELLVELDRRDFETAVIVAEAQLARAKSTHAQEKTRHEQARVNWEELFDEEPGELVLRLPQLREAEANVAAAEAQLKQAKRNLDRTAVRAPFDGRVRVRVVGVGQSVGTGTALGTIFATDFAEVRLPITARDMPFITLPEGPDEPAVEVELRDALGKSGSTWRATVIRTEGALDQSSLELFAIARVLDPFGLTTGEPPLRIGQPVVGIVPGHVLEDVIALPRSAVRQLDRVHFIDPDELTIQPTQIEPIWSDEEYIVIRDPALADGTLLAMTQLIYAPAGSKIEILPDAAPAMAAEVDSTSGAAMGASAKAQKGQDAE